MRAQLDALLQYKPKAVIVDFLFVDSRPDDTLPDLVDEIAALSKGGMCRSISKAASICPLARKPLRPELAATGVPILDPSVSDQRRRRAPIRRDRRLLQQPRPMPTAPAHRWRCACSRTSIRNIRWRRMNDMMELVWGTKTAPENHWITKTDADGTQRSCFTEMGAIRRVYLAFFDTSAVKSPCPYTAEFPVEALLIGRGRQGRRQDGHRPRHLLWRCAVEARRTRSTRRSTTCMPGVFVHAMALDNLITFHGHPEQNVISLGGKIQDGNLVQIIAIIPVILILSWLHMRACASGASASIGSAARPSNISSTRRSRSSGTSSPSSWRSASACS